MSENICSHCKKQYPTIEFDFRGNPILLKYKISGIAGICDDWEVKDHIDEMCPECYVIMIESLNENEQLEQKIELMKNCFNCKHGSEKDDEICEKCCNNSKWEWDEGKGWDDDE